MQFDPKKLTKLRGTATQERAAKKARVSLPTYNRAEKGKDISSRIAAKIAGAYGKEPEELERRNGDAA